MAFKRINVAFVLRVYKQKRPAFFSDLSDRYLLPDRVSIGLFIRKLCSLQQRKVDEFSCFSGVGGDE